VRRYAIGRAATPAEMAAWTTEIGPGGKELPTGSGTVATGTAIFAAKCASCHGANGEGMAPVYPALIGRDPKGENFVFDTDPKIVRTIGNYWPYATTVFDYVRRAMPHTQPGSLTNDEVYALTAYLLAANQVIPMNSTLDAASLRAVKMPYVDRFVRDDRRGGHEVR
jgi:mono/diheme cytochrome c family protein